MQQTAFQPDGMRSQHDCFRCIEGVAGAAGICIEDLCRSVLSVNPFD